MKKHLSRRKFLKLTSIAGVAATLPLSGCKKEPIKVDDVDIEAIVVGSGFGAAVSALRLTQAGVKTLMLEMGKQYDVDATPNPFTKTLSPDGRSTWLKRRTILPVTSIQFDIPKYVGVLDRVEYNTSYMRIYRGTCLGGGSVVYGAMLPYAQPSMWNEYFPYVSYDDMLNKWYPKVKNILDFSVIPDDILNSKYYKYARVGLEHCENAGMEKVMLNAGVNFNTIRSEIDGTTQKCSIDNQLLYGANNGFKNSLDRNYIPQANATGNLTIETLHKVDSVRQLSNKNYELTVHKINEQGETVAVKIYTCKYLFINAGVVGTMNILLKSKHLGGLANLSDEVGKHWGNNGNIMAMRSNLREDTGAEQGSVPVSAYGDLNNPITPLLAEQAPFPIGLELRQLLALAITKNPSRGHFKYNPATDNADLYFDKSQMEISRQAMKSFVDRLNAANGGTLEQFWYFNGKGYGDDFTYHPLGGAVYGLASDTTGRLKGYSNLYCLDGAAMPGFSCCANPALTIAALAERNMEKILAEDFS
ncbi:MAG: GMC oxidoreductase [Chitinophagales bacterium]|nr:GMC oxidoreductase [Chitinophagales bacterium]